MEDLSVSDVRSVVFLDNFVEPFRDFSLYIIEIDCLDNFLFRAFLLDNLSNLFFELFLIDKHVGTLAPVPTTCLSKNLSLIVSHVASTIAMILNIFTQAKVDRLVIKFAPVVG